MPYMNLGTRVPRHSASSASESASPGRSTLPAPVSQRNEVLDVPLLGPWPEGTEVIYLAMGCFWGPERIFWQLPGVVGTAVGYMGGETVDPTYDEVCSGRTGHAEAVLVAYDPTRIGTSEILKAFWENHDPTTANRQGNDIGTQYRSAIFPTTEEQRRVAEATREAFGATLAEAGRGPITTEIRFAGGEAGQAGSFYPAETVHQQYLHANPFGYCNHGFKGYSLDVSAIEESSGSPLWDQQPYLS